MKSLVTAVVTAYFFTAALALCLMLGSTPALAGDDAGIKPLYLKKCKVCHGPDGVGSKTGKKFGVPNFTDKEWQKTRDLAAITGTITNGSAKNKRMKAFKGKLKPEEIDALAKFVKAFGG